MSADAAIAPAVPRIGIAYLRQFRPLAPALCAVAFAVLWLVTRDDDLLGVLAGLGGSVVVALLYLAALRKLPLVRVLQLSVVIDALIIAFLVGQLPNPEQLAVAYLWSIGIAAFLLTPAWTILVTIEAAALTVIVPLLVGTGHTPTLLATDVIIFAVVGASLAFARRDEAQTQLAFERSARQLAEAQRVAQIGSWEWCPATGELHWSQEMYRLRGVDPADGPVSFEFYMQHLDPIERDTVRAAIAQTLDHGVPYDLDIPYLRPDGERGVLRALGELVPGRDGNDWLVGTAQDVTELRRAQALKDEFAATASHELRTPATIIGGFAQTLEDRWNDLDDAGRRDFVGHINVGARRLNRLVEDLLHVARIESRRLRVQPSVFALSDLVETAVADFASTRLSAQIEAAARGAEALGDPERLRQVLDNLVDNALRYSGDEQPVRVQLVGQSDHLEVRVIDAGPGVPVEHRQRVFERFERLTHNGDGTGLGLYIARQLVELQGGAIWISDEPGGHAFCFSVPRPR